MPSKLNSDLIEVNSIVHDFAINVIQLSQRHFT